MPNNHLPPNFKLPPMSRWLEYPVLFGNISNQLIEFTKLQQLWFSVDSGDGCWKNFPELHIRGGKKTPAEDLADCEAACLESPSCLSIDFNPKTKGCWLLDTQDNKETDKSIQHYDYVCAGEYEENRLLVTFIANFRAASIGISYALYCVTILQLLHVFSSSDSARFIKIK